MGKKRLTIVMPREEYAALEELADREERTVPQQATFLIRQVVTASERDGAVPR